MYGKTPAAVLLLQVGPVALAQYSLAQYSDESEKHSDGERHSDRTVTTESFVHVAHAAGA